MSVTLNTRSIVLLVATLGILVGFAVSQIATAQSGGAKVSAAPVKVTDAALLKETKKLNKAIGNTFIKGTVIDNLEAIMKNTGYTCREITGASALGDTCVTFVP